jgi:large subunit ribosomal protein L25
MTDTLEVTLRHETGKHRVRRQRQAGKTPAVLYGHGDENVILSAATEELHRLVHRGVQTVELAGDIREMALIRDVQWDTFGERILHVDFLRVGAREKVETTVTVELRGEAPGAKLGGMVEQPLHEVVILCPANAIPEQIEVKIMELGLNEQIRASELDLPPDATLVTPADEVVVQCTEVTPVEAEEIEVAPAEGVEPELISRKEVAEGDE